MSALGTSITGGEPFLVVDRVVEYTGALKQAFGADHHIHLYSASVPGEQILHSLRGLVDEIRLHPPPDEWPDILNSPFLEGVRRAKVFGFSAGFEVPALRGVETLVAALPDLDFLNLNELEWGETSADEMRRRGYRLVDDLHNAVEHSSRWAQPLRHHKKVHFCPSRFKDSVQLRERLKRIARNTARPFDEVTRDGTVKYGVAECTPDDHPTRSLVPEGRYQDCGDHLEMSWKHLERIAKRLPGNKYIIERYPNGGIIVEMIPL
jgi:Uncharacterized conserved protein related to pyruvate formate-lyase activating enzyme